MTHLKTQATSEHEHSMFVLSPRNFIFSNSTIIISYVLYSSLENFEMKSMPEFVRNTGSSKKMDGI